MTEVKQQPPLETGASISGSAEQQDSNTNESKDQPLHLTDSLMEDGALQMVPAQLQTLQMATRRDGAALPEPDADKSVADDKAQSDTGEEETLRDAVVRMVLESGCELFHDRNLSTYVTLPVNGHRETWRLRSEAFRRLIRYHWHELTGKGIGSGVVNDACDTLDASAAFTELEFAVHTRIAHHETGIYVDLCDNQWRAVHISTDGWQIVENPPVRFVRTKGMLPLPVPIPGGSLVALRPLINARTEEVWCLVVAWILAAFSPGPFPVLVLLGEQGCAKSFMCRVLRHLIDPSEVEVTTAPKESRDVIMAANNSYVVALDNLSKIPDWLSDLLCSIATGAAYRERKYHTNNGEEELFKAKRPLVLNGINFAMRDDLLSRSFLTSLPVIADADRRDENELRAAINEAAPNILGGIFDCLSSILKHLPSTRLDTKPRMADAALWVTAAESALGWAPGTFMRTYAGNRNQSVELALESDSFGLALHRFMLNRLGGEWIISWESMIEMLSGGQKVYGWPTTGQAVSARLTRLAPALRHVGVHWSHERNATQRYIKVWMEVSSPSLLTEPAPSMDLSDPIEANHDSCDGK